MTPEQIATLRAAFVGQTWESGAWTCTEVRDTGYRVMVFVRRHSGNYLDLDATGTDPVALAATIAAQVALREADIKTREAAEVEAAALAQLVGGEV
jgi:hypothetical protein